LKLSGLEVGLLINFHVPHLRLGIKRMVNNYKRVLTRKSRTFNRRGRPRNAKEQPSPRSPLRSFAVKCS
jgi:hypothetical protein